MSKLQCEDIAGSNWIAEMGSGRVVSVFFERVLGFWAWHEYVKKGKEFIRSWH